ncbi:DUF1998 domain-containing protein [Sphingobacterium sp.]|uniref:DUF1998 domain-containing protein n=1 Tax=Sphingobacterium sp. TaxID=341027 RepID=UPI0028A926E1|nr:DUF1998 domain-containing protein [Sphingobacterium sp.]
MKIRNINQYNQGIGKYKLLSSTAGVGSIITTKFGNYILVSDIFSWPFIKKANECIKVERQKQGKPEYLYFNSRIELDKIGIELVDDQRFVNFIKNEQALTELTCLINIPNISINESYNTINWKFHPIRAKIGENAKPYDYMITGTHFPKWFKDREGKLKTIKEWKELWSSKTVENKNGRPPMEHFAPPRNVNKKIGEPYEIRVNKEGKKELYTEYEVLQQTNMVLICSNGHLSDIPWPKYLRWKTEKIQSGNQLSEENVAENLFQMDDCCAQPVLIMSENNATSEGYGSIYIECRACGMGSGNDKLPKVNLEGINGIKPNCNCQKPWEINSNDNSTYLPTDISCVNPNNVKQTNTMKLSLVTANDIYYATGFSSLYIPLDWTSKISNNMRSILEIISLRFSKYCSKVSKPRKDIFWDEKLSIENFEDIIDDNGYALEGKLGEMYIQANKLFLEEEETIVDSQLDYKFQEYKTFVNHCLSPSTDGIPLIFNDIELSEELGSFFSKIQQIEELAITNVQFEFTRVKPKERIVVEGKNGIEVRSNSIGKKIFSKVDNEVFVLPANQCRGEGIFIQFDENKINNWISKNKNYLQERFQHLTERIISDTEQGAGIKNRVKNNGFKQFLIHSFSHLLMRELEFTCGYPTASLKERLYISNVDGKEMAGVLIYTAEGSEGSMGGLVSQANPGRLLTILKKGLERAENCSSDPLCWQNDKQGIYNLNMAACFSCSLVSETACEEMNLTLDRRILVDETFGYFKELL